MGDDGACFVQFPHPGGEHRPARDQMPWNTGPHRRKFLQVAGRHTAGADRPLESELVFWGEWEPPSTVVRRWPASARLPRSLHRPWWPQPAISGPRANTDPWVFGPRMRYSNCKQVTGPDRRPTAMQRLPRGSVICFGSTIDSEFCVDTVFVVASAEPWIPFHADDLEEDDAFKACTVTPTQEGERDAHASFTLYRGATFDDPVEGMFSFVPARVANTPDPRFARPAATYEFINPANRQSTWGSRRVLPRDQVRDAWESIRHQMLAAGLLLAVELQTPQPQEEPLTVPGWPYRQC